MQTQIKLTQLRFPKLIGDLAHSNQFLKMFSFISLVINLLSLILIYMLSTRSPVVLAFDSTANNLKAASMPKPEVEIQAAIKHYLDLRYQWTPENVKTKLELAQALVHPNALKSYVGAGQNVARFSTEKQVSQRVYGNSFDVDLEHKVVRINGDRITSIQNLRAAGKLKLELSFEFGPRTKANPWGIYVTKEVEET